MKKILISVLIIICLALSANAQITNLTVNNDVKLGELLTITGDYTTADTLCKFTILDLNGVAIERLSDEYTFSDGGFYSQRIISEPTYFRSQDYNIVVVCGTSQEDANFTVEQRRSIEHFAVEEFGYLFDRDNIDTFFIIGSIGLFLILVCFVFWFIIKSARGK